MRYIIYLKDKDVANRIKEVVKEVLPSAKGYIADNCTECLNKGTGYDYAFIGSDVDDGLPWMDLMFHLSAKGVGVYLVSNVINSDILKTVNEASGLSTISIDNLEEEMLGLFLRDDDKDLVEEESDEDEQIDNTETSEISIQEYALLKSKKYPAVIVSIHGAKGGVGKTNIAVNTAVALAKKGLKVIGVDFDIENGNFANVLHMIGEKDLKDVTKGNFNFTESAFDQHPSGLYILPGLKIPAEAEIISAEVAERIISRLAKLFDVIVIDTGSLEIDPMLIAMQVSTKAYFITTCDMTIIAKTYDMVEDAKIMGIDMNKIKIIVNMIGKNLNARSTYISDYIHLPILAEVPYDSEVISTVNNGQVPIDNTRCANYAKEISVIVEDIIKDTDLVAKVKKFDEEKSSKKRGFFRLWWK